MKKKCGKCGREIEEDEAEICWYCRGDLCAECWEERGHCGHPEADEANARIRAWYEAKRDDPLDA